MIQVPGLCSGSFFKSTFHLEWFSGFMDLYGTFFFSI